MLEAADEIGGGTRTQRGDPARPAARPLLGDPPDGRRLAVPDRSRAGAVRADVAAGPRSTACIRSTAAAPGCCTARSRTPPPASAPTARGGARCSAGPSATVRRARRGHHGAAAAGAAPSADAGPVRRADRAARVDARQVVPHRAGAGVVRRRCGACLPAAALPDDLGDRAGHPHRRAPPRLAGRGRRFAVDHQRAGSAAGRPGRQDRDRRPHRRGRRSCRPPT